MCHEPMRLIKLEPNFAGIPELRTFQCNECKNRNYTSTKNKKTTTERLEMKKFCPDCRKHQAHRDTK